MSDDNNITGKKIYKAAGAVSGSVAGAVSAAAVMSALAVSAPVLATVLVIPVVAGSGFLGFKAGQKNPAGGLLKILGAVGKDVW